MPRPLRVLYLSATGQLAGAETSLVDMMNQLDRAAFEPHVVVPEDGPLRQRLLDLDIDCQVLPLAPLKAKNPIPYLRTVWRLAHFLIKERIQLIHANMDICNQYAVIPAKVLRIPIVCHTRNILSRRAFRRMFLPFSDLLIANSQATLKSYARFWPIRQRRVMIPNIIDPARLQPVSAQPRQRWGIPENAFVALQMARITPPKRQHIFIQALLQLMPRYPTLWAVIAGDTQIDQSEDYRHQLQIQVQAAGLEQRVLFPGFVQEVGDLLAVADALVLTSEAEGFGRVLVEAMLAGKPVIATPSGGPNEIIRHGETGIFITPGDVNDLAGALERWLENPAAAQAIGERGRDWAKQHFSTAQSRQAMEEVYRETLARV